MGEKLKERLEEIVKGLEQKGITAGARVNIICGRNAEAVAIQIAEGVGLVVEEIHCEKDNNIFDENTAAFVKIEPPRPDYFPDLIKSITLGENEILAASALQEKSQRQFLRQQHKFAVKHSNKIKK